jgi:hypothetical protein
VFPLFGVVFLRIARAAAPLFSALVEVDEERFAMRPKERRNGRQKDLFRARRSDRRHGLFAGEVAATVDWGLLEERFGAGYADIRRPLATRLMADLAILKHVQGLSDKVLCERWVENPYFQLSCGEEFFQHKPPFDRSWLTRWRQRMGEKKLARVQESLAVATMTGVAKLSDFSKFIVDTTVQEMPPQLDALRDAGCDRIFEDRASGAKTYRPGLTQALALVREGDVFLTWTLDRLARSLRRLIETANQLEECGASLRSLTEAIDITTPGGMEADAPPACALWRAPCWRRCCRAAVRAGSTPSIRKPDDRCRHRSGC